MFSILQYLLGVTIIVDCLGPSCYSSPHFFPGQVPSVPFRMTVLFLRMGQHSIYLRLFEQLSLNRSLIVDARKSTVCYCLRSNVLCFNMLDMDSGS